MTLVIVLACLWIAAGVGAWFWAMHRVTDVTVGDLLGLVGMIIFGPSAWLIVAAEFGKFAFTRRVVWRRKDK